ncbi:hypothetical protein B5C26_06995 [Photorhabdus luminescens]|uniref:CDP-glycerol glycerophosphotransferase family protein n=1 Tax=Photorhabdus luminescens TaxID=29488 RepID=UPI000B4CDFD9|nr:CDP-glycerol glycerophosphotransferase family protein [Photorhabdus luminescens]OWO83342.1 hypothetical protein B5C26_06995 [Photorhabdus luminescens]
MKKTISKIIVIILEIFLSIIFMFIPKNRNKFIFNSHGNEKYNFYSRVLFEYYILNKEKHKYDVKFIINNKELRNKLNKEIGNYFISSLDPLGIIHCLRAKVWITSSKPVFTIPFSLINRRKINLWHGTPFKKIAIEDEYQPKFKKIIYKYYYAYFFYDLFVCPSYDVMDTFQRSFNLPEKKMLVAGSVVGDMFGKSIDTKSNSHFKKMMQKGRARKALYSPTYRDGIDTVFFPFEGLNKKEFEKFLEENNITIYIRPHHLEKNHEKYLNWKGIEYLGSDEITEITFYLNSFDILITDYSSIMFDYLLTNGNIIFIPYDYNRYKKSRGFNYSLEDVCYGPVVNDLNGFYKALKENSQNEYRKKREIIKKQFHTIDRGQCENIFKIIEEYI